MGINYFGLSILIWLAVGLITVLKRLYIDKELEGEKLEEKITKSRKEGAPQEIIDFYTKKSVYIIVGTILGFVGLYLDTRKTFKERKDISN